MRSLIQSRENQMSLFSAVNLKLHNLVTK